MSWLEWTVVLLLAERCVSIGYHMAVGARAVYQQATAKVAAEQARARPRMTVTRFQDGSSWYGPDRRDS